MWQIINNITGLLDTVRFISLTHPQLFIQITVLYVSHNHPAYFLSTKYTEINNSMFACVHLSEDKKKKYSHAIHGVRGIEQFVGVRGEMLQKSD